MHPQSPLNQTPKPSSRRFVLALSAVVSVTALFSILVLAFKTDAAVTYRNATDNGAVETISSLRPDGENGGLILALYPQYLDRETVDPTVGGAGVSLALALSIGLLCVFVRRRAKALLVSTSLSKLLGSMCA